VSSISILSASLSLEMKCVQIVPVGTSPIIDQCYNKSATHLAISSMHLFGATTVHHEPENVLKSHGKNSMSSDCRATVLQGMIPEI